MLAEGASRILEDGGCEEGLCYRFETVARMGLLKATREYSLYYWPESEQWTGDVVDSSGWRDLSDDECDALVAELFTA